MTKIVKISPLNVTSSHIGEAAEALKAGKTVVFPTETVYGLGANALDVSAVQKIFEAKGRPRDNPLIVHIARKEQLNDLVKEIPLSAAKLMKAFWPGPLTLILWKRESIPDSVTAGLPKVGIRMPSHPVAKALLFKANIPVAAPSANLSGKISPTHAEDVIDDLNGRVDMIIDGGNSQEGIESTVIDMTAEVPLLLRPGTVTKEQLEGVIGTIQLHPSLFSLLSPDTVASPGMKYKHYSPKSEMILVTPQKILSSIKQMKGQRMGLVTTMTEGTFPVKEHVHLGKNKKQIAKKIFRVLRQLDKKDLDIILVEAIDEEDIGLGIMNRLKKGAAKIIQ